MVKLSSEESDVEFVMCESEEVARDLRWLRVGSVGSDKGARFCWRRLEREARIGDGVFAKES